MDRVLGRDVEDMLSLLVLEEADLFVPVAGQLARDPADDLTILFNTCVLSLISVATSSGKISIIIQYKWISGRAAPWILRRCCN